MECIIRDDAWALPKVHKELDFLSVIDKRR